MNPPPLSASELVMIAATNGNFVCQADPVYRQCIARAIRTVADQVVPAPHPQQAYDSCCDVHKAAIRKQLLNIATELETIQ
jgi:hypothetical protein